MNNTKYQTYTVGSRVLVDVEGIKFPYYAKAALVMNPQKPTLFLALTRIFYANLCRCFQIY